MASSSLQSRFNCDYPCDRMLVSVDIDLSETEGSRDSTVLRQFKLAPAPLNAIGTPIRYVISSVLD